MMKKHCYGYVPAVIALAFVMLAGGCTTNNNTTAAPVTPSVDEHVLQFQNGVYPDSTYTYSMDTGMDSGSPTTNFDTISPFNTGALSGSISRYYIRFSTTSLLPNNVTVTKAYLTINVNSINGANSFAFYALTTAWNDYSSSWNGPWFTPGGDFTATAKSNVLAMNDLGSYVYKLDTAMVGGWVANPSTNYGVILRAVNETTGFNSAGVVTNADGQAAFRPMLTVYYTLP